MDLSPELFKIDRNSKLPLYDQIERNLRQLIIDGVLKEGDTVPSEWDLARYYGVSRLTVRHALDTLVQQNWLTKRQGVGTFVTRPKVATISFRELSFTRQMQAVGRQPSSRLINREVTTADRKIARYLSLEENAPVVSITRLRLADNLPILLENTYLSYERFPDLLTIPELIDGSLYQTLFDRYGIQIARMDQTLNPVLLNKEQAELLDTSPDSPSILSLVVAYSQQGEPIEFSTSVANGENSEFLFSFQKGESPQ